MRTLDDVRGRVLDLDSHLQFPFAALGSLFGDLAGRIGRARARRGIGAAQRAALGGRGSFQRPDRFDADNVWLVKGPNAPGASDARERLEVLDLMGIERQLIFPMVAVARAAWADAPGASEPMRRYNDHVLEWSSADPSRLRPTAVVSLRDPKAATAELDHVIAAGARAVLLPCTTPPAGLSPADAAWDPLWATLADAGVPATFHIGANDRFMSTAWRPAALPATAIDENPDEPAGPFDLAVAHLPVQVFLTAMILGGVLERHPTLRLGAIEFGAHWVGPMADLLDERAGVFARRMSRLLSLKPSEYIARQVRVTPAWFEPVDTYIERFGLEDVYAFSSDFPHPEGGTAPVADMFERVRRLGDDIVDKLFWRNGELLLPA